MARGEDAVTGPSYAERLARELDGEYDPVEDAGMVGGGDRFDDDEASADPPPRPPQSAYRPGVAPQKPEPAATKCDEKAPAARATASDATLSADALKSLETATPIEALRRVWGYDAFRAGQEDVLTAQLDGRDALAIMPTGAGKSICYQLPALLRPGLTLVVSPLIALMRDQVAALRAKGVPAAALHSGNALEKDAEIVQAVRDGSLKLLYCAPERLTRSDTLKLLAEARIVRIAVDEAHCVAEWGHDFRPDYLSIGLVRERLAAATGTRPPLSAFTATADAETRAEIIQKLFGAPADPKDAGPAVFIQGFDRPNITISFEHKRKAKARILDFARGRRGQSGVIYCASRRGVEQIAAHLSENGVPCLAYHAGLSPEEREANQAAFTQGDGVVMAATIAFGLGVDKADIRYVVHADLPKTVESYYQEIGRAGRDGAPAEALTLYGLEDMRQRRRRIELSDSPAERKRADRARLASLMRLTEAPVCRRETLLGYFGEEQDGPCGRCDLCLTAPEAYDGTVEAQKALSAIARTGERFGVSHLIAVLRGEATDAVLGFGHQSLPTFGVGDDLNRLAWRSVFRQLFAQGLIDTDGAENCVFSLTAAGRAVLKGERSVLLRRDPPAARDAGEAKETADAALLADLKRVRREIAAETQQPPQTLLTDRALSTIARRRPGSLEALGACDGVPRETLRRVGPRVLEAVRRAG